MLIGYAGVSTDDQILDLQRDAPSWAGYGRIFGQEGRQQTPCSESSDLGPLEAVLVAEKP